MTIVVRPLSAGRMLIIGSFASYLKARSWAFVMFLCGVLLSFRIVATEGRMSSFSASLNLRIPISIDGVISSIQSFYAR